MNNPDVTEKPVNPNTSASGRGCAAMWHVMKRTKGGKWRHHTWLKHAYEAASEVEWLRSQGWWGAKRTLKKLKQHNDPS